MKKTSLTKDRSKRRNGSAGKVLLAIMALRRGVGEGLERECHPATQETSGSQR